MRQPGLAIVIILRDTPADDGPFPAAWKNLLTFVLNGEFVPVARIGTRSVR